MLIDTIKSKLYSTATNDHVDVEVPRKESEWPYVWPEDEVEPYEGEKKVTNIVSKHTDENGTEHVFAGPDARNVIEGHQEGYNDVIWLGVGARYGEWASIKRESLRTHAVLWGKSGSGKSVSLKNIAKQLFGDGSGFWMFDGDNQTIDEIEESLTDEEWERTIIFDPSADKGRANHVVGFNPLDVGVDPDHPHFDDIVGDRCKIIVREMVASQHGGGALIEGAAETIVTIAMRLNITVTIPDLFYIIKSKKRREDFAEYAKKAGMYEEFLDYAEDIADMPDQKLDSLIRRLKSWVEDPRAMRFISHRESNINFNELVDKNAIVLCKLGMGDDSLKSMFAQVIRASLWAAINYRADTTPRHERDMIYLMEDEYDVLVSGENFDEDENQVVKNIFSKARKKDFSNIVASQYPSQIPEDIMDAILGNVSNFFSFELGIPDDCRLAAEVLDRDKSDFQNESAHHLWMRTEMSGAREKSQSYRIYTLPQYPPLRTRDEAKRKENEKVREWGSEKKSNPQIRQELLFVGEGGPDQPDGGGEADSALVLKDVLHGLYDAEKSAEMDSSHDSWGILPDEAKRLTERHRPENRNVSDTGFSSALEQLCERGHAQRQMTNGTMEFKTTHDGRSFLFDQGDGGQSGKSEHKGLVRDQHKHCTKWGYKYEIIPQGDNETLPDGLLTEPLDISGSGQRRRKKLKELKEDHPIRWVLTAGDDAHVEVESSTIRGRVPQKVTRNLAKGLEESKITLFVVSEYICDGKTQDPNDDPTRLARRVERYIHDEEYLERADINPENVDPDDYAVIVIPDEGNSHWDDPAPRLWFGEFDSEDESDWLTTSTENLPGMTQELETPVSVGISAIRSDLRKEQRPEEKIDPIDPIEPI